MRRLTFVVFLIRHSSPQLNAIARMQSRGWLIQHIGESGPPLISCSGVFHYTYFNASIRLSDMAQAPPKGEWIADPHPKLHSAAASLLAVTQAQTSDDIVRKKVNLAYGNSSLKLMCNAKCLVSRLGVTGSPAMETYSITFFSPCPDPPSVMRRAVTSDSLDTRLPNLSSVSSCLHSMSIIC